MKTKLVRCVLVAGCFAGVGSCYLAAQTVVSGGASSSAATTDTSASISAPAVSAPAPTETVPPVLVAPSLDPRAPDDWVVRMTILAEISRFAAQRAQIVADRTALLDQLKAAAPADRQAVIDALRAQAKDLVEEQRALGKQIREQLRQLRKNPSTLGGG
jgi:hypothetical protein